MSPIQKLNIRTLVERALRALPERNRDVLKSRFGVGKDGRETLEAIGRRYHITRERVRQIEKASLAKLRSRDEYELFTPLFERVESFIDERGGLVMEEEILRDLVPSSQGPHLSLVLNLGEQFALIGENDEFHPLWAKSEETAKQLQDVLLRVASHLQKNGTAVEWGNLLDIAKKEAEKSNLQFSPDVLARHMSIAKSIARGPFGKYGLAHWPQINPRGVRDKAYLVLAESAKRPLHFREIAQLIDKVAFARKRANTHPQTVHNELIKDPRFVLVGRGMYGLVEWGYRPGTVREVLLSVMKEAKRPLSREEIVKLVSKQRFVQENTIVLNLQNRKHFARTAEGRYTLVA